MKIDSLSGAGAATPTLAKNDQQQDSTDSGAILQDLFPLECLGRILEEMGRAICATERTPEALAGCCLLGILSASIGSGLCVQSGPNRTTRGNIYILGSAESGSGKSETFRHAARPFYAFEAECIKVWEESVRPGLIAQKQLLEIEVARIKKQAANGTSKSGISRDEALRLLESKNRELQETEDQLHAPTLSAEDVTTERLGVMLAQNREQLASLSADAVSIVNILLGGYSKLDRTDEGLYLKAFSGDTHRTDRQTRDAVLLQSPCLTALWLTQPDKVEDLLKKRSLSEGGLIPRMLICHTQCEAREIGDDTPAMPEEVVASYAGLIRDLLTNCRLADGPSTVHPTPEARERLNEHFNAIVRRRQAGGDLRDIQSFAARWNEHAWRISVCLHAAEYGSQCVSRPIELDTACRAIVVADWFATQQLEILSAGRTKAKREKRDEVIKLLIDNPKGVTARDVLNARIKSDAESCRALLAEMEAEGQLAGEDVKSERGGWVRRVYRLPKR